MSIATLKKKTAKSYKIMSSGFSSFSLNGTHRSQGYVGQTCLSRSLPKTMMKGNVACGHGGCCGTYKITPIVQSAVTSLNNPNVVKSSVITTTGMIENKYRWAKRPEPYAIVKPDSNNNLNTQNDYIAHLKRKTINKINNCNFNQSQPKTFCVSKYNQLFRSDLHPKRAVTICNNTVLDNYLVSSYTDDYLVTLDNSCSTNNDTFFIANNSRNTPMIGNN